jgi:hypothetical protein
MDNEVDPRVRQIIDEKRLSGPRLSPVEIVAKMGVFDARDKPYEHAWLATGDSVIATIWAEYVRVGSAGRWFYLESLNTALRAGGGARPPNLVQRAKDRVALLKRTYDAGQGFRALLQTNRVPIAELESNRKAKISTRVRDDEEWHVATWSPEEQFAILVRGPRGWTPTDAELQEAMAHANLPVSSSSASALVAASEGQGDSLQSAAMDYVVRHFSSYGYKADVVSGRGLGYDIEVADKKGTTLLRVAVRGTSTATPGFQLADDERSCSAREKLWRLLVVTDPLSGAAQHKIYRSSEVPQAPGFQAS